MKKFYDEKTEGGIDVSASQGLNISQTTATTDHVLSLHEGKATIAFHVGNEKTTRVSVTITTRELAKWLPELIEQLENRE